MVQIELDIGWRLVYQLGPMKAGYVAIIGQPNVGKSTLLNRLIGEELAIVTPKPQTTRENILGILNKENAQVVFLDTPGFHKSNKPLNVSMLENIEEALKDADIVVLVVEPKKIPDRIEMELFNRIAPSPSPLPQGERVIIVINKIDGVMTEPWGHVVERYYSEFKNSPTIALSAKTGQGCEILVNKIIDQLPEGEPFYPQDEFTTHNMRFLAAEIIREQAMINLKQELPYALKVDISSFKEEPGKIGLARIQATIIVEKDSQKGIVIGAGGSMIKKIGTIAREKIEKLTGTKVFLELFVKVEKDWTKNVIIKG